MLPLTRLNRRVGSAIIERIAAGKTLPEEVTNQILARTDGVPLFLEELTKTVLEGGLLQERDGHYVLDRPLPALAIPTTLHDSLMARLDRLATVRLVAQTGAAIGREFSYTLLHAVSSLTEDDLRAALATLVDSELIFLRGTPPDAVYSFKHALVQDAAHNSMLRSYRQQLHAQIAKALETQFPDIIENRPELLAQHFAEAGLSEKSATYWGTAGHRSTARSAMAEAAAQFRKGLDQLALLPDNVEHQRLELQFRAALGAVLNAVKGNAASETGQAYARARELWEELGSPSEFLHVPYGQSRYHLFRGEVDLAQKLAEELLHLSRQRNDSGGLILGHFSSGRNLMLAGRFAASRSHLAEVIALYDPVSHDSLVHQVASHPHTNSQTFLGLVLFCLGYPDLGLRESNAAVGEAQRLAHPQSLAVSLTYGNILLLLVGDNTAFDKQAKQLLSLAIEQGFRHWHAEATVYRGWLNVKNGNVIEGISLLRSGSTAYRSTGAEAWTPNHIALVARAYEIAGKVEKPWRRWTTLCRLLKEQECGGSQQS